MSIFHYSHRFPKPLVISWGFTFSAASEKMLTSIPNYTRKKMFLLKEGNSSLFMQITANKQLQYRKSTNISMDFFWHSFTRLLLNLHWKMDQAALGIVSKAISTLGKQDKDQHNTDYYTSSLLTACRGAYLFPLTLL